MRRRNINVVVVAIQAMSEARKVGDCRQAGKPGQYASRRVAGRSVGLHRIVYEAVNGPPPPDRPLVAHSCHEPSCIAVAHIHAASPAQNSAEMVAAGRSLKGEKNPKAKLTAADVLRARDLVKAGSTITDIAADLGVTRAALGYAVRGVTWSHVA